MCRLQSQTIFNISQLDTNLYKAIGISKAKHQRHLPVAVDGGNSKQSPGSHINDFADVSLTHTNLPMNGETRPWLKYKPSGNQENYGYKDAKQDPKLQPPIMKKKDNATAIYHKVIEEVANNTLGVFLEHYGDDSVHVKFQELWKLKLKKKKDKLARLAGNVPPAVIVETPLPDLNPLCERRKECGSEIGTFTQEVPPLAPLQTTVSIPFPGESIQFQSLPTNQDGNGTNSESTAYTELGKAGSCKRPSIPAFPNPGFEEAKPKQHKMQQLHQPWLKQNPFGIQNNTGLVDARQTSELQPFAMSGYIHQQNGEGDNIFQFSAYQKNVDLSTSPIRK
ncbi:hypothetical protein PTKIN_Ptkin09bG0047600 [Pterospermum kingtungense]